MNSSNSINTNKITTKTLALNGVMIALVFIVTYFTWIPTWVGPFNLGDTVVIITAIFLGRKSAFLAGALGASLADLAMGYTYFAPATFFVKGLEGFIIGLIIYKFVGNQKVNQSIVRLVAVITGSLVMISGYFISELYLLKIFDESMGITAAMRDLPVNLVQGGVCTLIGYTLSIVLDKYKISKYILS
ncbi:MAG: ECF transporter S component [Bacillota bacterium]